MKSFRGFTRLVSIAVVILSLNILPASARGSNASLMAPTAPPCRTPLISTPNRPFLNSSVDVIIPIAAPTAAFPTRPKGPPNNVAIAPIPAPFRVFGSMSLIIFFSLEVIPSSPSSPKYFSLNFSLLLTHPRAAPAIKPPIGPNGVSSPGIMPAIPNFSIFGAYFCTASMIDLDTIPDPSRLPSLPSLPNSLSFNTSELAMIDEPAPTAAPTNGPPTNPNKRDTVPPTNPPAKPSGTSFLA